MYSRRYRDGRKRPEFIYNTEGFRTAFLVPGSGILCRLPLHLVSTDLELLLILQLFLSPSKRRNPTVCAQFCPLPLSVPETAMGVTLNAQQNGDSEYIQAIHR